MDPLRTRWILALAFCLLLAGTTRGQDIPEPSDVPPSERMFFRHWVNQLADAARSPKTKLEAAEGLLTRTYPEAEAAVVAFLKDASNPQAQIAIAEAIASTTAGRPSFVDPLMALLTGDNEAAWQPAARALASFKDDGIVGKLVAVATDGNRPRSTRLACLVALKHMLDKRAVDALVTLLDDSDPVVSKAAKDALEFITKIRGMSVADWKRWWAKNKSKNREEWLADLTESIVRAKNELETENAHLRERLAQTIRRLYALTAPGQQNALLGQILRDPISDVRVVGIELVESRIAENAPVPKEIRVQIRGLLSDPNAPVRRQATLAVAHLGDAEALPLLLERMGQEDSSEVVQALLNAAGQMRSDEALPAVVDHLDATDEAVASAAAMALARIADARPLERELLDKAVEALTEVYSRYKQGKNDVATRESLLTAMGALGDRRCIPVLSEALKDAQARVRRASVSAIARLGLAEQAATIEPYLADPDQGVRQACVVALGELGGHRYLKAILGRTDPEVESQLAVRQEAWRVASSILSSADAALLAEVLQLLENRQDGLDMRIELQQTYVEKLRAQQRSADLPGAQLALAEMLLEDSRPAEAARHLEEVHSAYTASRDPQTGDVWRLWLRALLEANDAAGIEKLSGQRDPQQFAKGIELLQSRIDRLRQEGQWAAVVPLAGRAVSSLSGRLPRAEAQALRAALEEARRKLRAADRDRVAKLLNQMGTGEEAAQQAAMAEIRSMGDRAIGPLLAALRGAVEADPPAVQAERRILAILEQIAPKLNGYDVSDPVAKRLALIDSWLKNL